MPLRELAKEILTDDRLEDGGYFSSDPIQISDGDVVGLVLLNSGSPEREDDIRDYLFRQYTDPAGQFSGRNRLVHKVVSHLKASRRAARVRDQFESIGGGASLNLLSREQAVAIKRRIQSRIPEGKSVHLESYSASRYGSPSCLDVVEKMKRDGVTKVVLAPLYPQYARSTSGSAFAFWFSLQESGKIPAWETTCIREFSEEDGYVRAVSDRIDQALQRFPQNMRRDVHFLFVGQGARVPTFKKKDPYCCLLHHTIERVMSLRGEDREYSLGFLRSGMRSEWLTPSVSNAVQGIAKRRKAILAIPIDTVTEQLDTVFGLDIELRTLAEELRVAYYDVTSGLNCHPLFIEAVSELVLLRLAGMTPAESTELRGVLTSVQPCPGRTDKWVGRESHSQCVTCPFQEMSSTRSLELRRPAKSSLGRVAL